MKPTKKISISTFFGHIRGLIILNLFGLAVLLVSCNGCGGVKKGTSTSKTEKGSTNKQTPIVEITEDTTTQDWKNKHYYFGTNIPLPDSIKQRTPRLGKDVWVSLYKYEYKPIQYDDRHNPNIKFLKIYFVDSLSNDTTNSFSLIDKNPYADLPFENVESLRDRNVWGIIRYDLSNAREADVNHFLSSIGATPSKETKITNIEVMTGTYHTDEAESIAISYAIMARDDEDRIVANQTTYFAFDRYGNQIGHLVENGYGLYQCAITRDGKYLAAAFGGRFGCGQGEYIAPYFKIFDLSNNKVVHYEPLEFSNGIRVFYNYFVITRGGGIGKSRLYGIYNIDSNTYFEKLFPYPLGTDGWKPKSVLINGKDILFDSQEFIMKSLNPLNPQN